MATTLVQTLVVREGKVLLGRWKPGSGAFAGRVTALLGAAQRGPGGASSPEAAAVSAAAALGGSLTMTRLRRRGLFSFKELDSTHDAAVALGDEYTEHQMVYRLRASEPFELEPNDRFEAIGWFGQGELPFDEMPEDDKIWYDQVLFQDARLRGSFAFQGTSLVNHHLQPVSPAEGLCHEDPVAVPLPPKLGEEPLLISNPNCSKSCALRQALDVAGVKYVERQYLQAPLSLSELETLSARLEVQDELPAGKLCRDSELAATGEEKILEALAERPELLQRPVLVKGWRAAIGRPKPEDALKLL